MVNHRQLPRAAFRGRKLSSWRKLNTHAQEMMHTGKLISRFK